jgi:hypothetical protein
METLMNFTEQPKLKISGYCGKVAFRLVTIQTTFYLSIKIQEVLILLQGLPVFKLRQQMIFYRTTILWTILLLASCNFSR